MKGKKTKSMKFSPLRRLNLHKSRPCNICGEIYRPHSSFDRYCGQCKHREELLRFSDWLPEIDEALTTRVSV